MSYRPRARTLSVALASVSNIDSGQSGATHRLGRKTTFGERAWPVKKVANGPREDTDETPNNHIFFVVALSKVISLAPGA